MPDIILYLFSGFLFVQVFNFIALHKNPSNYQHIIIKSLLAGYILNNLYKSIPYTYQSNVYLNTTLYLIVCLVLGYLTAIFCRSNFFKKLCRFLKIRRTVNEFIWSDIEDKKYGLWVRAVNHEIGIDYLGQLCLYEEFQRYPIIVLERYQKLDGDGNVLEDYSARPNEKIIIDTSKCNHLELTYNLKSDNVK